jgi:hypothetical protein
MIARVASFEGIDVQAAQQSMEETEAIIRPMVEGLSGYRGALELVSPEGKFLSITLFDSLENAQAAEPTFDKEMPQQLGHIFERWAGRRVSVDRYEVAGQDSH